MSGKHRRPKQQKQQKKGGSKFSRNWNYVPRARSRVYDLTRDSDEYVTGAPARSSGEKRVGYDEGEEFQQERGDGDSRGPHPTACPAERPKTASAQATAEASLGVSGSSAAAVAAATTPEKVRAEPQAASPVPGRVIDKQAEPSPAPTVAAQKSPDGAAPVKPVVADPATSGLDKAAEKATKEIAASPTASATTAPTAKNMIATTETTSTTTSTAPRVSAPAPKAATAAAAAAAAAATTTTTAVSTVARSKSQGPDSLVLCRVCRRKRYLWRFSEARRAANDFICDPCERGQRAVATATSTIASAVASTVPSAERALLRDERVREMSDEERYARIVANLRGRERKALAAINRLDLLNMTGSRLPIHRQDIRVAKGAGSDEFSAIEARHLIENVFKRTSSLSGAKLELSECALARRDFSRPFCMHTNVALLSTPELKCLRNRHHDKDIIVIGEQLPSRPRQIAAAAAAAASVAPVAAIDNADGRLLGNSSGPNKQPRASGGARGAPTAIAAAAAAAAAEAATTAVPPHFYAPSAPGRYDQAPPLPLPPPPLFRHNIGEATHAHRGRPLDTATRSQLHGGDKRDYGGRDAAPYTAGSSKAQKRRRAIAYDDDDDDDDYSSVSDDDDDSETSSAESETDKGDDESSGDSQYQRKGEAGATRKRPRRTEDDAVVAGPYCTQCGKQRGDGRYCTWCGKDNAAAQQPRHSRQKHNQYRRRRHRRRRHGEEEDGGASHYRPMHGEAHIRSPP